MAIGDYVDITSFVQGGLINDADVTLRNCRFMRYDYDGNSEETTVFAFDMEVEDGDDDEAHTQVYSLGGGPDAWEVADGGNRIKQATGKAKITNSSNFALLMEDFKRCGLDVAAFGGDVSKLDDTKCHVLRKDVKGRSDLDGSEGDAEGRKRGNQYLGVTEVTTWGYDAKSKKGRRKKAAPAKAKPDSDSEETDEAEALAASLVSEVLSDDPVMDLKPLAMMVYKKSTGNPTPLRKEVRQLVLDTDWLAGLDNVEVDGETITWEGD